jgi:hypothetical protein
MLPQVQAKGGERTLPMDRQRAGFPSFEDWAKISEDEQDALLFRMEAERRRKSRVLWLGTFVGVATAAYVGLPIWR